ncbi:TonB-dependent receptor [Rhodobacter sp. 24-YEA-8]|uniref:TonB-dependent receptor n=1 Tax=Rhodobacter sp. 24-YEA-8 TaxID=1884310 RepID=UPI0008970318|nr:TonB-dependent receptor [Rhodobacter sp. 24-YEA-8]SED61185.1 hemoglobin/transferrin/lactoferrin receptor protein [Rhodobacter sp. 24-YEA-8]
MTAPHFSGQRPASRAKGWFLLTTILCCLATAPALRAETEARPGMAESRFDIPAQPLPSALAAFIKATGWQLSYPSSAAQGKMSPGVRGAMSPAEALERLVAGSGLAVHQGGANAAALVEQSRDQGAADGSVMLGTIVLGSAQMADAAFTTPGSVNVITTEQIDRFTTGTVSDVFKSAPGVISAGNRVGPSVDLNIRGLQGQSRVSVTVDGARQTSGSYRGYRGSRNETYIDPDFIAGVDISKGPSSGAGGVGAMGGVVNMTTINAEDVLAPGKDQGFRLRFGTASNSVGAPATGTEAGRSGGSGFNGDAWNGSVAWAMKRENFDLVLGASRRRSGNYFTGSHGQENYNTTVHGTRLPRDRPISVYGKDSEVFNTSQDVATYLGKATWTWGDHSLRLNVSHYRNVYGETDETMLNFGLPGSIIYIPPSEFIHSKTTTKSVGLSYSYTPDNELIDLRASLWATEVDTTSGVIRSQLGGTGETSNRTFGGDITNTSHISTGAGLWTMSNGIEAVLERGRSDQITLVYPWATSYLSANPNANRRLASFFHKSKLEINDWLTVSGGFRYDYYSLEGKGLTAGLGDQSRNQLSRNFGITLAPLEGMQIFATYTEGWRPPSLREQGAFGAGSITINPDLEPERAKNIELGVNYARDGLLRDDDQMRVKFVLFRNDYEDYIIRKRAPLSTYTWGNIEKAAFRGAELTLNYDTGAFFVEGNVTHYSKVEMCDAGTCGFTTGATDYGIVNMPPRTSGSLTGGARMLEDHRLTLGLRAWHTGQRYSGYVMPAGAVNPPTYYTKSTILDLFGSYRVNETSSLDFSVENLTDRFYIEPLSATPQAAPGRTARVNFTMKF